MKTFCFDSHKDWDNWVRMLLFAERESFQESLGFSPFEHEKYIWIPDLTELC
jgi:hypothetical protein